MRKRIEDFVIWVVLPVAFWLSVVLLMAGCRTHRETVTDRNTLRVDSSVTTRHEEQEHLTWTDTSWTDSHTMTVTEVGFAATDSIVPTVVIDRAGRLHIRGAVNHITQTTKTAQKQKRGGKITAGKQTKDKSTADVSRKDDDRHKEVKVTKTGGGMPWWVPFAGVVAIAAAGWLWVRYRRPIIRWWYRATKQDC